MIYIGKINPISFFQIVGGNNEPQDWGFEFMEVDNVERCQFVALNEITDLFVQSDTTPILDIPSSVTATITDITPISWNGLASKVFKISLIFTSSEIIKIRMRDAVAFYESEYIKAGDNVNDYIKVVASHSENDFGAFVGYPITYYLDSEFVENIPVNELITYQNDRGILEKLRATPNDSFKLNGFKLIAHKISMWNLLFSLDSIIINKQKYQTSEVPAVTRAEVSNLFDIEVNIQLQENDYCVYTENIYPDFKESVEFWLKKDSSEFDIMLNGGSYFLFSDPYTVINIPNGISTIDTGEFGAHVGLYFGDNTENINSLFYQDENIIKVILKESKNIKNIEGAFSKMTEVTDIILTDRLDKLETIRTMFSYCPKLETITSVYTDLTNAVDSDYFISNCNVLTTYPDFKLPKTTDFYAAYAGLAVIDNIFVDITNNATSVYHALSHNDSLTTIFGVIDTRNTNDNSEIFYNSPNITTPTAAEQAALQAAGGALWKNPR